MVYKRSTILALILLLIALHLAAGDIRHITIKDGLSSRQVYELEEDKDGFIWMYTNSGLERYDGYHFRHYSLDSREESNDHIASATTMQLDRFGTLWIASKSGSIYSYDRNLDRFVRRIKIDEPGTSIYHFALLDNGNIAIGTNKGLYLGIENKSPICIALDNMLVSYVLPHGKRIYAGTQKGAYRIDLDNNNAEQLLTASKDIYVKSLGIASGQLYVGPFAGSVFAIDLESERKRHLPFSTPPIPVNAMQTMGADTLLIGVDGAGVYMIDSCDGRLLNHYRDGDNSPHELSGSTVSDILVDHEGGLWISTSHSGVNYLPPYESSLSIIKPERGNSNSLLTSHVNAVFEDSFGELWIGTDKGVSRYKPTTGQWHHYLQNHDYSANIILSIGEDIYHNIWVGSYGEGAACINRDTHEVKHLPTLSPENNKGIGTQYLFTSFGDNNGNVWFGGINGLVTKYNVRNNTYTHYDEDCISTATMGKNGSVVLAGNKGAGIYNPNDDSFKWTTKFDSIEIQYPVRSLLIDPDKDEMWIGTVGEGLILHNYGRGSARRFSTADGLSSNTIYSILRDKLGATWICTESDLYRYNPTTESFACFTNFAWNKRDFDQVSFNPGGCVGKNGDVILASPEGCIIFNPNHESDKIVSSRLMLTNLSLNDKAVSPSDDNSPLPQNIDMVQHLVLDHKFNNIAIDFAVINFKSPNRIEYEYMLEGYDKNYKNAGSLRQAKYTALDPGKYVLHIRAIDLYNSSYICERHLPVTLNSPWWQTWWAILFYILILLTITILSIGYLRNRRREKRIENQIRTFANIAHDIRTPMSMIKTPLINVEQEHGLSEDGRRNLTIVRAGIDKTMNMLTAMLEIPGGKVGREHLAIEMCDIRDFISEKCLEFRPLAMLKNLELSWEIDPDIPQQVPIDTEKLDHIIDNLLSNAIKYTFAGSVFIRAYANDSKRWKISVKDTGLGISKSDSRRIFNYRHRGSEAMKNNIPGTGMGLLLTKRLVRLLRGKIIFESCYGKGSEFIVTLPLDYGTANVVQHKENKTDSTNGGNDLSSPADERKRIFIIDDDADLRNFLKETLGKEYNMTLFDNATEALQHIREDNPDLVIADVMMPKLRGDEMCKIIKNDMSTSHIPIILLSGLTARHDIVSGLESNADDYIVKPFDLIVLKARIRNIIKNRQRLNRQVLAEDSKPEDAEYTNELDRQFMVNVMKKMNDKLSESEFSVVDLCAELGMSRTSVYNKIRSITGQSVNEFMRIVRLNKSKELLSTGMYNVSEVAYMVGFSDPKYFSTCFKKQFGISPSKFGSAPQS